MYYLLNIELSRVLAESDKLNSIITVLRSCIDKYELSRSSINSKENYKP